MRRHLYLFVSVGLVAALTTSTWAQDEGGGRRRGGGGFGGGMGFGRGLTIDKAMLAGSEQVRKELKVTEEQGKKIEGVLASYREAQREIFGGQRNREASDEERKKINEERTQKRAELTKKTDGALAEVLTKEQNQRLNEIHLQQQGVDALSTESVVAALKLTDEQKAKIKGVISTRDADSEKLMPARRRGEGAPEGPPAGGFEEIREKREKIRKDAETAAFAVLTKEQTESLAKLKGAAFELDRASLRGTGGFGGGGRGGRGGQGGGEDAKRERPKADEEI